MLTRVGEWSLLRGDLRGDGIAFWGDGAAFPGDAADFLGDFRGLTKSCRTKVNITRSPLPPS